eukprot:GHVT01088085.1.p2 GENE.GHVT01088085.1~~GHVT01088085.1.p2  ORF type:complete len:464 (+),score=24.72 GHVT01088085.1:79-1470(+)
MLHIIRQCDMCLVFTAAVSKMDPQSMKSAQCSLLTADDRTEIADAESNAQGSGSHEVTADSVDYTVSCDTAVHGNGTSPTVSTFSLGNQFRNLVSSYRSAKSLGSQWMNGEWLRNNTARTVTYVIGCIMAIAGVVILLHFMWADSGAPAPTVVNISRQAVSSSPALTSQKIQLQLKHTSGAPSFQERTARSLLSPDASGILPGVPNPNLAGPEYERNSMENNAQLSASNYPLIGFSDTQLFEALEDDTIVHEHLGQIAPHSAAFPVNIWEWTELHFSTAFDLFSRQFRKEYENDKDQILRFHIFRSNLIFVHKFNHQDYSFSMRLNHFGDITEQEFKTLYTGYKPRDRAQHGRELDSTDQDDPTNKDKGLLRSIRKESNYRRQALSRAYLGVDKTLADVSNVTLPESVDWRKQGCVTPVKDQKQWYATLHLQTQSLAFRDFNWQPQIRPSSQLQIISRCIRIF